MSDGGAAPNPGALAVVRPGERVLTVRALITELLSMPMHAHVWIDGETVLATSVRSAGESVVIR